MIDHPRPYLVTYRTVAGDEHKVSVRAYNLMEAFQTVAVQLAGNGLKDIKLIDVVPDEQAVQADVETSRADAASAFVASLLRKPRV